MASELMITHRRRQYSVGQGFFHAANVEFMGGEFKYIYDCGSDNTDLLLVAIEEYLGRNDLADVLFISHFDFDHVGGLDRLLLKLKIHTAILPYISKAERLGLIADGLLGGRLDSSYARFCQDPAGWLGERGVDVVIFVLPSDRGPADIVRPEVTSPPSPVPRVTFDWETMKQHFKEDLFKDQLLPDQAEPPRPNVHFIENHVPLQLSASGYIINWMFLPFVHPEPSSEKLFVERLQSDFKDLVDTKTMRLDQSRIFTILKSFDEREKLKKAYSTIRENRNLTSMSLYSGPINLDEHVKVRMFTSFMPNGRFQDKCAWLGTGDANLKTKSRRLAFQRHYGKFFNSVATFALPHHGSIHNFHEELLQLDAKFCVACAVKPSKDHPHPEVSRAIRRAHKHLISVNQDPLTALTEEVMLIWRP